ncbi:MAG TPA: response regulator [Caulobacteraceae bacterium]|nr:response regulator [Caulobacteraceae bacterium]
MKSLRVLLVEDEGLVAMMLEDLIVDLGCEIAGSLGTVESALAWIEAGGAADVALLDVNLCGEPVYPVADALEARGVPFAFATGYGEGHDPRFKDAPLLGKPIRQERLEALLRSYGYED